MKSSRKRPLIPTGMAARALGVSPVWLRQLVERGEIRAERDAGGRHLFEMSAVMALAGKRAAERATGARR